MNLPNFLTNLRIALAVLFLWLIFLAGFPAKFLALLAFLLASLTDYWDGRLARKNNQVTSFGRLMDPIADKILTLSAFLAFVQLGLMPAWMVILIITRDLLITGVRLVMPADSLSQGTRKSGKHKTVLQFTAIIGVLIFICLRETSFWQSAWTHEALAFIHYVMLFIVGITLWSGIRYLMANKDFLPGE